MSTYRCKCGKHEFDDNNQLPPPCVGCVECGTGFSDNPDNYPAVQPHAKLIPRFDGDGNHTHNRCEDCKQAVSLEGVE